jgi:hypothetical protein
MKKTLGGAALVLVLLAPAAVSAQTSGDVQATARILASLTVTELTDLDFGGMLPGVGSTVAVGSASAGLGELQIDHDSDFSVVATVPTQLLNGANFLDVAFVCGYSAASQGALTGASFDCGSPPQPGSPGSATTTYLQVGGDITGANTTGKVPGDYTATLSFSFSAVY